MKEKLRNLLIVDADAWARQAAKQALELRRYRVLLARDGAEAMEIVCSQAPDLVVLDLQLGRDDAWQILREIGRAHPGVPVVLTTGQAGQRGRAVRAGAQALVEKPFEANAFLLLIEELLRQAPELPRRVTGREECCHFLPRRFDLCLVNLEERYCAPLPLPEFRLRPSHSDVLDVRLRSGNPGLSDPRSKRRFAEAHA